MYCSLSISQALNRAVKVIYGEVLTAGGQASRSVAPSPIITMFSKPYCSFSMRITVPFPPVCAVGWDSSKPAYSPDRAQHHLISHRLTPAARRDKGGSYHWSRTSGGLRRRGVEECWAATPRVQRCSGNRLRWGRPSRYADEASAPAPWGDKHFINKPQIQYLILYNG